MVIDKFSDSDMRLAQTAHEAKRTKYLILQPRISDITPNGTEIFFIADEANKNTIPVTFSSSFGENVFLISCSVMSVNLNHAEAQQWWNEWQKSATMEENIKSGQK